MFPKISAFKQISIKILFEDIIKYTYIGLHYVESLGDIRVRLVLCNGLVEMLHDRCFEVLMFHVACDADTQLRDEDQQQEHGKL